jgi:hypothetical protein
MPDLPEWVIWAAITLAWIVTFALVGAIVWRM